MDVHTIFGVALSFSVPLWFRRDHCFWWTRTCLGRNSLTCELVLLLNLFCLVHFRTLFFCTRLFHDDGYIYVFI